MKIRKKHNFDRKAYYKKIYGRIEGEPHGISVWGRFGAAKMSMGEVAEIMGISRQAVQLLERKALYKIRRAMAPYMAELREEQ